MCIIAVLAAGVNFHFGMKGEGFWQKALNGFNLMAEVCPGHAEDLHTATYTVNVGGTYSIWKDHINLIAELNDGKFLAEVYSLNYISNN